MDPRYNDTVTKDFAAVIKKLDMDPSKARILHTFEQFFFVNHTILIKIKNVCFLKE